MFSNFAWSEILVIACVAIIVVGPKDLPGMLRQLGKSIGSIKRMAGDFQRQFNDAIKDAELDELKDMTSTKGFGPLEDARKSMEEFAETIKDPIEADPQTDVLPPEPEVAAKEADAKPAKPAAKASAAKKAPAKKPAARKTTASKTTTAKSTAAKKPAARKTASKKPAASAKSAS